MPLTRQRVAEAAKLRRERLVAEQEEASRKEEAEAQKAMLAQQIDMLTAVFEQDELFRAARDGDLNEIQRQIAEKANLKIKNEDSWTPLHLAATYGHEAVVKALVEADKSLVNESGYDGHKPLHCAAEAAHGNEATYLKIVQFLVDNGADVHGTSEIYLGFNHHTPLSAASKANKQHIVDYLLSKGAYLPASQSEAQEDASTSDNSDSDIPPSQPAALSVGVAENKHVHCEVSVSKKGVVHVEINAKQFTPALCRVNVSTQQGRETKSFGHATISPPKARNTAKQLFRADVNEDDDSIQDSSDDDLGTPQKPQHSRRGRRPKFRRADCQYF